MRYTTCLTLSLLLGALALLSGCSAGRNAFSAAEKYEAAGKYEDAMYSYAEAFRKDPDTSLYRARFLKARDAAAEQRYKRGLEQFRDRNYSAALEDFQAAYGFDQSRDRYRQQAELVTRIKDAQAAFEEGIEFEKSNKLKEAGFSFARALELTPDNKEYQTALNRVLASRKSRLAGYDLSLKSPKPITLKFKDAKLKEVFSIITKLSGINFVFDEGVKDQPISIYLENATFQQALDLLVSMNKLGRKVLNESTVVIYPKSPDKVKQYEEMELRTFHLTYLEVKKAVNLIRGMIQVRKLQPNEDSNTLIVRDVRDVVDVVEKILDANDVPDPEVLLDVEVIEISDKNSTNVGLLLSDYNVKIGAFNQAGTAMAQTLEAATQTTGPMTTTSTTVNGITTTTTAPSILPNAGVDNLVKIFSSKVLGFNGFMTVPTATYNLGKTLAKGEVLANPKIRVKNKEKSKFNVGTRVPITTTATTNQTTQVNVQYVDVGVKVSAEPTIQLNNEVSIKLSLEVSSILNKETVGSDKSTSVVTIGTRNLDTVLSLKDGETTIIGGLIQKNSNSSKTKIFLLGDLPLIGPLLSGNDSSKDKTELVLAITPRLVRGVTVPRTDLTAFMSGKEDEPAVIGPMASFDEEPAFKGAKESAGQDKKGAPPAAKPQKPLPEIPASPAAVQPKATSEVPAAPAAVPSKAPAEIPATPAAALPSSEVVPAPSPVVQPPAPPVSTPSPAALPAKEAPAAAPASQPASWLPDRGTLETLAPDAIKTGQPVEIGIKAGFLSGLKQARFVLSYDAARLECPSVTEGPLFKANGKETAFAGTADPLAGTLTVDVSRKGTDEGVSGTGIVATATCRAKAEGPAQLRFTSSSFTSIQGKPYEMVPFDRTITILP